MKIDAKRLQAAIPKVGARLAKMPDLEMDAKDWADELAEMVEDITTVDPLLDLIEPGETESNFGLALLIGASAVGAPKTATSIGKLRSFETNIGDFRVHHGDLVVKRGDLEVQEGLIVTEDLEVGGVLSVTSEWTSVLVGGDVTARGATIGKDQIMIGGALRIAEALTLMEGTVGVGGVFEAPLVIEWLGGVTAKKAKVKHRFTSDEVQGQARKTRAKLETILAPGLFSPKDKDDDVLAVVRRLGEQMKKKKRIWAA